MKLINSNNENAIHWNANEVIGNWKNKVDQERLNSTEFITPVLHREFPIDEFEFIQNRPVFSSEQGQELNKLGPWTYYVPFVGGSTQDAGSFTEATIKFHRYRAELICGTTQLLLGDRYNETTILDIACNCGVFSLEASERGAKQVVGIDIRKENIRQAQGLLNLCNAYLPKMEPMDVKFVTGDVRDEDNFERDWDVIFNLGLMYHLSSPLQTLQDCYTYTNEFCVIDSICHKEPFSGFHLVNGKNPDSPIEGDLSYELQPTYRGLVDAIKAVGFKDVIEVVGNLHGEVDLYSSGVRRCLIAFKEDSAPYLDKFK